MRKISIILTALLFISVMNAQDLKVIKLNAPDKARGTAVMKAFSDRHSDREYAAKELSAQDLSDLLWAANGINRTDGKRTAPSALNKQDIDVYVIMKDGAYLYDAKAHALNPIMCKLKERSRRELCSVSNANGNLLDAAIPMNCSFSSS